MSDGWKRIDNDTIEKGDWRIYRAKLPKDAFFVSYKGEIKGRFETAQQAKDFVAGCKSGRVCSGE